MISFLRFAGASLSLLAGGVALAQTTIIGGSLGNGNFNGNGAGAGSGVTLTYADTPNWHHAAGAETWNFVFTSGMIGSDDSNSGGGYTFNNRITVNDTGYTITAAGEVFALSYQFGAGGGAANWASGNDFLRSYLFTATAAVDENLVVGNMTPLSSNDDYYMNQPVNGIWTYHANSAFYTSSAVDIGKTVYLAMVFIDDGAGTGGPRVENVELTVTTGDTPPPPPVGETNITVLAGSIGNADFNAGGGGTDGGVQTFDQTPNWFNASGDESVNFTQSSQMGGSTDPENATTTRGGMPWARLALNDTGYTITSEGEQFNISFDFGTGGTGWDDDEEIRMFLFSASATVDGSITPSQITELGDVSISLSSSDEQWTTKRVSGFYTSTSGDVGQTVYLGFEFSNPGGALVYPRIDTINLNVDVGAEPGTDPGTDPGATAWSEFVEQYGLSGYYLTDADGDGASDRVEFAHGGNPTNPADKGVMPAMVHTDSTVQFSALERTDSNPGITYVAEWTENLTNEVWQTAFVSTSSAPSQVASYDEVRYDFQDAGQSEAFFRSRIAPNGRRPNILLIMADDLGYADVSFNHPYSGPNVNNAYNGTAQISTPELDSLANSGTIFTSAYVVHPFCGPSRMGLMAGRYPHEFGGPFNLPVSSSGYYTDQGIDTNEVLMSTMLHEAGYKTGLMGKWHLGEQAEHHPNNRGFDEFYGMLGGGIVYWGPYQSGGWSYYHYPEENGVADTTLGANDHITDVLTDKGIDFLEQSATNDAPFFLFMSYNAPHSILVSNGRDQAKPEDLAFYADVPDQMRRNYLGLVRHMDRRIGDLVQTLKDTGQYENTLIVFLSDNGGRYDSVGGWGDNGVLRGRKGDVTEGGFRVPMFMHWPGMIPSGVTYDHPVTALDFYPTFARLADTGIPADKDIDGKDIWDTLLHKEDSRPGEPIYTVTYSTSAASVGIRQDNWKALKIGTQTWKLYNITNDISEVTDVSGANQTVLSNLVSQGSFWSDDHVQPLWWNNPSQEADWNNNNMPHYETVFTLPKRVEH